MTKDKDKVKMLDVQAGYETPVSTFDRNSIGYTDRPLNSKTQIRGLDLDYCYITCNKNIPATGTRTNVDDNVVQSAHGLYKLSEREPSFASHGVVKIPANGVYQVYFVATYDSKTYSSNPTLGTMVELFAGAGWQDLSLSPNGTFTQQRHINFTGTFIKGDELMPKLYISAGTSCDVYGEMYVTKISS